MRIYVGGTFDLFHWGHVELLRRAKEMGHVTVALNTDEFVEEFKDEKPFMTLEERTKVVEACKYVDEVIVNTGGADSKPSILEVNPDVIVVGDDWENRGYIHQIDVSDEFMEEHNIQLKFIPYTQGISSSDIKKRLCQT